MNTDTFIKKNQRKNLMLTKTKARNYMNIQNYKRKHFSSKIYLFHLIMFIFIILFPHNQGENIAKIIFPKQSSTTTSLSVITDTTSITKMTVNGDSVAKAKSVKAPDKINEVVVEITFKDDLTKCEKLFNGMTKIVAMDFSKLDTSKCTSFNIMFQGANKVTSIKIGPGFRTGSATDMSGMFASFGASGCIHNFGFEQFDTSQVTTMANMFKGSCFRYLDLSSFNTANVQTMASMFESSKALSLDLSGFNTEKVTSFNGMFSSMTSLVSLQISSFTFKNTPDLTHIFYQMAAYLKLCPDDKSIKTLQAQLTEASKTSKCDDPCFDHSTENLFSSGECITDCQASTNTYQYESECVKSCPSGTEEYPVGSYMCVTILDCSKSFYNIDKSDCIDEVPDGYYCNDLTKKTIAKCPDNCGKCELASVNLNLCTECNSLLFYYQAQNYDSNSDGYISCFTEAPTGYYFDVGEAMYKPCYESCKTCNELGDSSNHKCLSCKDGLIDGLPNCYEKCPSGELYYFDDSNGFHCVSSCPSDYNLVAEREKCTKDCTKESPFLYQYEGDCLDACPEKYHAPNADKICVLALHCDTYYNYEYTACVDEIPEGFYCNNTEAKTIDKCNSKCKTCSLESVSKGLCNSCNNDIGYYYMEDDDQNTDDQKNCINSFPINYFLEVNVYKKCYKSCKSCDALGDVNEHLCKDCPDDYTKNGTSNCYKICDYHYYFDSYNEYFCTESEECPEGRSKLIVDKNECVEACIGDYRFEFDNKCYTACPPGSFYNFDQTNCIGEVPIGYYLNDTQTIDKCHKKCKECNLGSVNDEGYACISCANELSFYKKEDDIRSNNFYDCVTGIQDGYYLDIDNNEYKKCHKTCKSCDELGDVRNNKCTGCYSGSTLNGTNCFEICQYYHYFDDSGEYFCSDGQTCPSSRRKLIVDTHECVEDCIGQYPFEFEDKCYTECPPWTYYNYTQTGCLGSIPIGYYMNDSIKRTIEKCEEKCESECILDTDNNNVICRGCNNELDYYKKEGDAEKDGYYECYTGPMETFFIDHTENEYKRCYVTCLFCNELGDAVEHKCTGCSEKYIFNGTNCFLNCDYYHYFDSNKVYQCTEGEECPPDFPYLIVGEKSCVSSCPAKLIFDLNQCTDECTGKYKFEFDDKCYTGCPPGTYYNFTQTGCIDSIPTGYYMNDSLKRTINKCDIKCENECLLDGQSNKVLCKGCNNELNYYKKTDDPEKDGYYDCYTGRMEKYYIDEEDKEYKKCYESCLYCDELGEILNHKCTGCSKEYTLNKTNCYEICRYFYYFDSDGIYHCTERDECVPIAPNKIPEKKTCVKNCEDEEKYNMVFESRCYEKCPIYYNFEQTECIGQMPEGYYLNDSDARTIDKCIEKCETCNTESVKIGQCLKCNNEKDYYIKDDDKDNIDEYINCYNSRIEGYYLDEKEKKYNKCFEKCKNCDEKGVITEHKCIECFDGFTLNGTNCYEVCPYYYYFDAEGIYHCTETDTCPFKYNLIPEKYQCIDDCEKDDVYIYEHRGICLDAPYVQYCNDTSMFIEIETGDCVEDCPVINFIQNYCGLRNNTLLNQDYVINLLTDAIENGTLKGYIGEIVDGISDGYLIMEDTITYHLTALKGNNLLKNTLSNVSTLDLGECENKLKDKYEIDANLPLIILKIDYYVNYSLIPIIGYEIFHPLTMQKLDLSVCENNVLNLNVPTDKINESSLYAYDPDSSYYTDECSPTASEESYDIILSDRQNHFIKNNLSICEVNCVLKEYDSENKKSICECSIKSSIYNSTVVHNKTDNFLSEFSTSKSSSVNSIKCASTLFSKDGIMKNIALYIYIFLIIGLVVCCVQFYRKGYDSLKGHINLILTTKEKKTEEEAPKMDNFDDFGDKINQKTLDKILKLRTPKNFRSDFKGVIAKDDINYQDNYSNNQKSINKLEIYNFKNNVDVDNNYHLETEKEVTYSDFEINSFSYKQAIGVDLRTFKQIYKSMIKYNHPILFTFNNTKDYNSIYTKISLIFISFSLYYFVNSLFITKSMVHDIYENENSNNIGKMIVYIIISFIICYVLDKIIKYISLSDNNIYSIYKESLYNNAKIRATQVRKILFVKYIIFYVLGFGSLLIFGYYLAAFGSVYKNTQFVLIKNVLISFIISLVFPFIIVVLPSVLRRYSLKDATRQSMFNASRVFQYI